MKLILLIVLVFCQIALANTYPSFTSASNILVQSEAIRLRIAPFYGESSAGAVSIANVRIFPKEYSISNLTESASNKSIANVPQFSKYKLNKKQQIVETSALDAKQVLLTKNIAEIATIDTPDPFSIRLEFDWKEPHGQFMHQLLKDIKTAKQEGDTERYKGLTAQYQIWADLYLIKGTPTRVMK